MCGVTIHQRNMDKHGQTYGDLIRLDRAHHTPPETLRRVPLAASATDRKFDESFLQDLLFRFPETLPISNIDAAYAGAVPVCRELWTSAGYVDALYVNALGRLTLAEFKLWRNPQARREVIGQILDYTKELASWSYEDLQREVSKALQKKGNVLYELIREHSPEVSEAQFVDNVTRHLKRGEFLLLIVGDGIREGVENIVDFVQRHSGLHFTLALVESALYRDDADCLIVQPRVLARTEIVRRIVVEDNVLRKAIVIDDGDDDLPSDHERQNLRFWTAVLQGYSFHDVTVDIPAPSKESTVYVKVRDSGFGDWGLSFGGFLYRQSPTIGCYLTCRKDIPLAVHIYGEITASFEDLRKEMGADLVRWDNRAGRPRIGFKRQDRLSFLTGSDKTDDFKEAVSWMQKRLNCLVSTLHPRLRSMISSTEQ